MDRLFSFIAAIRTTKDYAASLMFVGITIVAGWLIALPLVGTVQRATIDRFHLTSPSFAIWAAQQPIPPMYNLENRYWYSTRPLSEVDLIRPAANDVRAETVNHFPARMITCASGRLLVNNPHDSSWLYLWSKYQGSEKLTAYRLEPIENSNAIRMHRMEPFP